MNKILNILVALLFGGLLAGCMQPPSPQRTSRGDQLGGGKIVGVEARAEIGDYAVTYQFQDGRKQYLLRELSPSEQIRVLKTKAHLSEKELIYQRQLIEITQHPPAN